MMIDTSNLNLDFTTLKLDNFDNNLVRALLKCLGKHKILQDNYSGDLKLSKKITGTSLMLEDDSGYFYKHINFFNERELLFYYTILLSSSGMNLINHFRNDSKPNNIEFLKIYQKKNKLENKSHHKNLKTTKISHERTLNGIISQSSNFEAHNPLLNEKVNEGDSNNPNFQIKPTYQIFESPHAQKELLHKIKLQLKKFYGLESIIQFSSTMHQLKSLNLVPEFLGINHAAMTFEEDHNSTHETKWSKIPENRNPSCISMIQLNNLFNGYERPSILDIKLGSGYIGEHSGQPGFEERIKFSHFHKAKRDSITENWRSLKKILRSKFNFIEAAFKIQNINPASIGFDSDDDFQNQTSLHNLLKSWRQEKVVKETTQSSLGFRVCGCSFTDDKGEEIHIDTKQGASFDKPQALDLINRFLTNAKLDEIDKQKLIKQIQSLTNWICSQPYYHFYATSLVVYYDIIHPRKISIKWLDFAHAIPQFSQLGPRYLNCENHQQVNSHIKWGLDNFIEIINSL